ncbi:MAG: diguanylate cyclase [Gallionellaceae bacterium]|nr:diguanylate cyclase [Gallionellaceae bacterium]
MRKTKQKIHAHPVLIIGAGRGGSALLEMFQGDELVKVVAIADINQDAPGLKLAKKLRIPFYTNTAEALSTCKEHPDCIVFNLTHDDAVTGEVSRIFGDKNAICGIEAKLFWQMVTNLQRVRGELEKSQSQLMAIIRHVMDGIIMINESGGILGFNPAAEKIFGYSQKEVLGKNVNMLMPEPFRSEHDSHIQHYIQTGATGEEGVIGVVSREREAVRKNGQHFPMDLSVSEMPLKEGRYFVGIFRDITERKLAEQKIEHLAHHDYLTGLPNRVFFLGRLQQSVALAKRCNYKVAVLFMDLDGFKNINDTLGHQAGDMLLQEAACRIKKVIRESDTVARLGGDEFTLVLNNVDTRENISRVAKNILAALSEPFAVDDQVCRVGASIGVSVFPDDAQDSCILLTQADEAMYTAKHLGKNTYYFYQDMADDGLSS